MLTILWHDVESAGYTDQIQMDWLVREGIRKGVVHIVSGPRSGQYKAKCDIDVQGAFVDFDYRPYADFNDAHDMYIGVMRLRFAGPDRVRIVQVLWKQKGQRNFVPCSTTATYVADSKHDFDAQVARSRNLPGEERRKRLAKARRRPLRTQVVSTVFLRNPDVVAEVLCRSSGVCERCKKPAPFQRAADGIPYLEVHHKKRLVDGGDDTVENAIAVCPNCHREAHYG